MKSSKISKVASIAVVTSALLAGIAAGGPAGEVRLTPGKILSGSTTNRSVTVTRTGAWSPAAVFVHYSSSPTGSVSFTRTSGLSTAVLYSTGTTGTPFAVWTPTVPYVFDGSSSLVVSSAVSAFSVEVHTHAGW